MRRRVVVTGAGVISSIATGREEFWDALQAMRSGAKLVELDRFGIIGAFPAPEDDGAEERFGRRNARRMDRAGRLAAVATALALEDAGELGVPAERIGCAIGSAHGGADTMPRGVHDVLRARRRSDVAVLDPARPPEHRRQRGRA